MSAAMFTSGTQEDISSKLRVFDCAVCVMQAKLYPRVLAAMKPGATLGLSHGFLLGVMQNDGVDFRDDINVILNAPKVRVDLNLAA